MQQPQRPWAPSEYQYKASAEKVYIYFHKEELEPYDGYDDYDDEDEDDDDGLTEQQRKLPKKEPHKVSLAWLMTQVPEGIKPEDIKIDFGAHTSRERYEHHHVGFYYEVKIPSRMKQYKIDLAKFKADLAQYEIDMAAYREWQKQEEIRKMEEKLRELKSEPCGLCNRRNCENCPCR